MGVVEVIYAIGITAVATLIVSVLSWVFRRQLGQAIAALDMSTGAVLGWVMAFIILAVFIMFTLNDLEVPETLRGVFAVMIGVLLASTVWKRR